MAASSRRLLNTEVEAGEIDDVYDDGDEAVVEKEFEDLLVSNNNLSNNNNGKKSNKYRSQKNYNY